MKHTKLLIISLSIGVLLSLTIFIIRYCIRCYVREAFEDISVDTIYATMDLVNTNDAARRSLVRSALIKARAQLLNLLRHLTTKVSPDCYDAKDVAYNTSGCRATRNQRQQEIDTFVKQAQVDYCKGQSDCKSINRAAYITKIWKAKCDAARKLKLQQAALNANLLKKTNDDFVVLTNTGLKTSCVKTIGGASIPKANQLSTERLVDAIRKLSGVDQANTIIVSTDNVSFCGELKSNVETELVTVPKSVILLRKLGKNNTKAPEEIVKLVQSTDTWLDSYWYFGDDSKIKTDADRLQKCSETLSADEFLTMGNNEFEKAAAKTIAEDVAQIKGGPDNSAASTQVIVDEYMNKRSQQKYPLNWYTDWQKALSDRYTAVQKTYSTRMTDLNRIQQQPLFTAYKKYNNLITLAQNDMTTAAKTISNFGNGSYSGYPICFAKSTEAQFNDLKCCSLKTDKATYVSYCPELKSICAEVAKADPTSRLFRNCKDTFANQINFNKYLKDLETFKKVPAFKKLSDDMAVINATQASTLVEIGLLEKTLKLTNADVISA